MTDQKALHGLNCPNCGGLVNIPEGQLIVRCPYCDLRSFVHGERGILRYQVPQAVDRKKAVDSLRSFLKGNWAIARNASNQAQLSEAFLAYLPFWVVWGRVMGWAFGQKKIRSGDKTRYEPREVQIIEEMSWNGAACDVGEFGVNQIPLVDQPLEAFDPDTLHTQGLVFEPVNSFTEACSEAEAHFQLRINSRARLDRISQLFVRFMRRRFGMVYYPLWILRYLYRGRAYQVVVDGNSGKVLYGKAPGNTLYRAAALVLGMAAGAFIAVDLPALVFSQASDSDGVFFFGLFLIVAGFGLMAAAYRAFRYGEQYEYRSGKPPLAKELLQMRDLPTNVQDIETWIGRLS